MSSKIHIENPLLPKGSLVLVTGANGLIASHVTDQLLEAGYNVRGAVRSAKKCAYLVPLYTSRHGPDRFALHEVPDFSAPGTWDSAVRGVDAIAHVVGAVDVYVKDIDTSLKEELSWQIALLEAAQREKSVKSFACTASAWSAWTPRAGERVVLDENSFNNEAVKLARSGQVGGMVGFMALKGLVEKEVWDWVKRENPRFAFNTLLPETVFGEVLDPRHQGIPSTAGMVYWAWQGKHVEVLDMMEPQWCIDCRDAARLHVAVLASLPRVDRERVYGFGDKWSWFEVVNILKRLYPEHADKMARVKNGGRSEAQPPRQRGEELLRRLGQQGWTSLETSIRQTAESWLKLEDGNVTGDAYSGFVN